jgi:putative phosphoribosyl transferase
MAPIEPRAVNISDLKLKGLLGIPQQTRGVVIFAHGSGSGRLSPRNTHVAAALRRAELATLLLDLLTPEEEANRANVFDIGLLANRLALATDWAEQNVELSRLPIGYFGASTGAGAALTAAAKDRRISAVVSRGGRPDLAGDALARVHAPTLLIVGSLDEPVIELNRMAQSRLKAENELVIVPGASHLFVEQGTLDEVVRHAIGWFLLHLAGRKVRSA